MIRILVERGADMNTVNKVDTNCMNSYYQDGQTPLHMAAEDGHSNNFKTLVELGADVQQLDDVGFILYFDQLLASSILPSSCSWKAR